MNSEPFQYLNASWRETYQNQHYYGWHGVELHGWLRKLVWKQNCNLFLFLKRIEGLLLWNPMCSWLVLCFVEFLLKSIIQEMQFVLLHTDLYQHCFLSHSNSENIYICWNIEHQLILRSSYLIRGTTIQSQRCKRRSDSSSCKNKALWWDKISWIDPSTASHETRGKPS
jgi:hypothetical protein